MSDYMNRMLSSSGYEYQPTWEELVVIEPRLSGLIADAKSEPECDEYLFSEYKMQMTKLVGFFAQIDNDVLTSPAAYDLAYDKLLEATGRS